MLPDAGRDHGKLWAFVALKSLRSPTALVTKRNNVEHRQAVQHDPVMAANDRTGRARAQTSREQEPGCSYLQFITCWSKSAAPLSAL